MGRRFCPRGWIRGAKEKGGGVGIVEYGHLGTKTLGRNYHYTAYSVLKKRTTQNGFVG